MILLDEEVIEEEVEGEYDQPLARKTKILKQAQDLSIGSIQEGAKMLASALKNKAMEEPSNDEVLKEQAL